MAVVAATLLTACDVKDPIYNTPHPDHGKIILTTDWSGIGSGITAPQSYTVKVGDYSATLSGATNTIDKLFDPGNYPLDVYNTADNIAVSGTTATANYTTGALGWFFTCAMNEAIAKDTDYAITAMMAQQVRQLTIVIEPTGSTIDRITGISATLSGVAGTLDFATGTHGAPSNVALTFTKITSGADAGKWTATVRLLGVTGAEQKLSGTIKFTDGSPADRSLESDLITELVNFNTDKKTPLTLGGTVVETQFEAGFTATITKWVEISSSGVAW